MENVFRTIHASFLVDNAVLENYRAVFLCEKKGNRMREKQKVKESTDRLEKGVYKGYDSALSIMVQAEQLIDQLEAEKTIFTSNERNLIMNYAYKLDDMDKTRELAEKLAYREQYAQQDVRQAVLNAQAEIDALPNPMIGLSEMRTYGYIWNEMLPLTNEKALEMFEQDFPGVEIEGVMSEEMEAMVWEKQMPDLTPAERLAVGIDRLAYD